MKVLVISNTGAGYAREVDCESNLKVSDLFKREMPTSSKSSDFIIRVNRLPCTSDQALQNGDRISITPLKVEGAR